MAQRKFGRISSATAESTSLEFLKNSGSTVLITMNEYLIPFVIPSILWFGGGSEEFVGNFRVFAGVKEQYNYSWSTVFVMLVTLQILYQC